MSKATDTRNNDTLRDDAPHGSKKSPEQLEREVDQARSRLGSTAHELSDRLSPGELIDQALGMAREHGGELGRNLGAQVKNNPLPMILTSIGISWMMMSSGKPAAARTQRAYDTGAYGSRAGQDGHSLKDAVGDVAAKSRDKAASVSDHMHEAATDVRESAHDARASLMQFYREQPLIAGSLGIAIGAVLGALVPPTDIEDDIFGQASDRSVDVATSKAAEKYDEVRESM